MEKFYLALITVKCGSDRRGCAKSQCPKTDAAESSNSALIIDGAALVNDIQINLDVLTNLL